MKPDKVFVLMLVILLPLTGCIDVSDNAGAEDSTDSGDDGMTVVNNYYNNTTTVVQQQEPDLIHDYISMDEMETWNITIGDAKVLEWVHSSVIYELEYSDGSTVNNEVEGLIYEASCNYNGTVLDLGYAGATSGGFAFKADGDCTYVFGDIPYANAVDVHIHLLYRIHEVQGV